MKKSVILKIAIPILFFSFSVKSFSEEKFVYAFNGFKGQVPEKLILVGRVIAKDRVQVLSKIQDSLEYNLRPWQVFVQVFSKDGLYVGQSLFVLRRSKQHRDSRSILKVGILKITSIFETSHAGWVLTGEGNFKSVKLDDLVGAPVKIKDYPGAVVIKKKGDFYFNKGDYGRAITSYKEALSVRPNYPQVRLALGKAYGSTIFGSDLRSMMNILKYLN